VSQLQLLPPASPLVDRLGADFFRSLPDRPGVYYLCNARDGILYIGKAASLRRRLGAYRIAHPDRVSRKIFRLLFATERILWDECADEPAARAREIQLLRAVQPRFNTADVRPPARPYLGWEFASDRLSLTLASSAEGLPNVLGPFPGGLLNVAAALFRLLELALKRPTHLTDFPGSLFRWPPPSRHLIPLSQQCRNVSDIARLLPEYLSGRGASLPSLLAGIVDGLPAPPPRQSWLEDLDTLNRFHHRLRVP
jgi:predicted GIY-YIG superfamily endonuclease